MSGDADQYDFFVSYARKDNANGWITRFLEELLVEHRKFSGGREFRPFFDKQDIRSLDDWHHRLYESLAKSRLLVAFISPSYFASEWCRREWRTWIDIEIAKHVLSDGVAPVYIVEVPWLTSAMSEQQIAEEIIRLSDRRADGVPVRDVVAVSGQVKQRQLTQVRPFYGAGLEALRKEDLRKVLAGLAKDLSDRSEHVRAAADSRSTIPPYNRRFVGRLGELTLLRERLHQGRTGVISGHKGDFPEDKSGIASVHGLGGIGKTELAFTYAHAFAGLYPGGRFLVPCDGSADLRQAMLALDEIFHVEISDEQRKTLDLHFGTIRDCLRRRLHEMGRILLVIDNVTDTRLLGPEQMDTVRALGPNLHLLATTRLGAPEGGGTFDDVHWLTLGELNLEDSLRLLEKHRAFAILGEQAAAESITRRLGGFALCVEVVGAYLSQHPDESYSTFLEKMGLEDLEQVDAAAERKETVTRRHNNEKRLGAILALTLAKLTTPERTTLDFAALLPPDHVVLPWLKTLVGATQHPQSGSRGRFNALVSWLSKRPGATERAESWTDIERHLTSLALITRSQDSDGDARVGRCHRLVQDYLKARMTDRMSKQQAINTFIRGRDVEIKKTTEWDDARWELQPLASLAGLWDELGNPYSAWLTNQVAVKLEALAAWSEAEPLMRRALAIELERRGNGHPYVSSRLNNLARLLIATNRYSEAEPLLRQALAIDKANVAHTDTDLPRTLNNLAALLKDTNRLAEAEGLMREALALDQKKRGNNHPETAIDLNNIALLLVEKNQLAEAEPIMKRVLAMEEAKHGSSHHEVARALMNLGGLYVKAGRFREAEPLLKQALATYKKTLGQHHPSVATCLNALVVLFMQSNRLREAEPLTREALAIDEASHGPNHPTVAGQLNSLASLLQETDRHAEAEPLLRRALSILEKSFGPNHPNVGATVNNLAQLLQQTDQLAQAEPLMRRALAIEEASRGPHHPEVATRLNNLGALLKATNRLAEAEPLMRRALAIDEAGLPSDHFDIARDLSQLAGLLMDKNRFQEAEPLQRRLVLILLKFTATTGQRHPILESAFINYWGLLHMELKVPKPDVFARFTKLCLEAGLDQSKGIELVTSIFSGKLESKLKIDMTLEKRLEYVAFLDKMIAPARAGKPPDFQKMIREHAHLMDLGLIDTMRETAKKLRRSNELYDQREAEFLDAMASKLEPTIRGIFQKRGRP